MSTYCEQAADRAWTELFKAGSNHIGERGTPRVSWYFMRPKWEKFGKWWSYVGSDGDCEIRNGRLHEPMMLLLFYVREGDIVTQYAWPEPSLGFNCDRSIHSEKTTITVRTGAAQ